MRRSTKHMEAHTPDTKIGAGDYYGSGIKNPVGKLRESYAIGPRPNQKLSKPPRSLA